MLVARANSKCVHALLCEFQQQVVCQTSRYHQENDGDKVPVQSEAEGKTAPEAAVFFLHALSLHAVVLQIPPRSKSNLNWKCLQSPVDD